MSQPSNQPLNIAFVQIAPCIRNYKMASALRGRGHNVTLLYHQRKLSEMYPGLSDDVYNASHKFGNLQELWSLLEAFDLVHCHNQPDDLTVAALAGPVPVIHDTHDLISLREDFSDKSKSGQVKFFESVANRGAHGRVYSTPYQQELARQLYDVRGESLVLYNYVSAGDLPQKHLPKLSASDGKVHIVYQGGISNTSHRDFGGLFIELAKRGICMHIYPTSYSQPLADAFAKHPNIHYNQPVSPKVIMQEMTQYDIGVIPFNFEQGNRRFLDSTIANKLFEYMAAGLPVLTSPLRSYVDYFDSNPVGAVFNSTDELVSLLPRMKEIAAATDWSKQVFTYESEIHRLEAFYRHVLARHRSAMNTAAVDERAQADHVDPAGPDAGDKCAICDSASTEQVHQQDNVKLIRCDECGVHFVHPAPQPEALRQWYSEQAKARRWGGDLTKAIEANHRQNAFYYDEYFRLAGEAIDLKATGRVLEVGCYSGLFLKRFADIGWECVGIDLNEGFARYGRDEFGLDLRCGQLDDFKFADRSFDLVVFNQLLEHLPDPQSFLAEVRRVCKPGGAVLLSVPNAGDIRHRLEELIGGGDIEDFFEFPNHLFYFSTQSLSLLMQRAGFDVALHRTIAAPDNLQDYQARRKCDESSVTQAKEALLTHRGQQGDEGQKAISTYITRALLNAVTRIAQDVAELADDLPGQVMVAHPVHAATDGLGETAPQTDNESTDRPQLAVIDASDAEALIDGLFLPARSGQFAQGKSPPVPSGATSLPVGPALEVAAAPDEHTSDAADELSDRVAEAVSSLRAWIDNHGWASHDPQTLRSYVLGQHASRQLTGEQAKEILQQESILRGELYERLELLPRVSAESVALIMRAHVLSGDVSDDSEVAACRDWLTSHAAGNITGLGWGVPYDRQATVVVPANVPTATVTCLAGAALWALWQVTGSEADRQLVTAIGEFLANDLNQDRLDDERLCFSRTPLDFDHVHSVNLCVAELLARLGVDCRRDDWLDLARRATAFSLADLTNEGSLHVWAGGFEPTDARVGLIRHLHTAASVRSLARLNGALPDLTGLAEASHRIAEFYLDELFDADGIPVMRPGDRGVVEIRAAAVAAETLAEIAHTAPQAIGILRKLLDWLLSVARNADGSFAHTVDLAGGPTDAWPFVRTGQAAVLCGLTCAMTALSSSRQPTAPTAAGQ